MTERSRDQSQKPKPTFAAYREEAAFPTQAARRRAAARTPTNDNDPGDEAKPADASAAIVNPANDGRPDLPDETPDGLSELEEEVRRRTEDPGNDRS